jgi:hypothetical protein
MIIWGYAFYVQVHEVAPRCPRKRGATERKKLHKKKRGDRRGRRQGGNCMYIAGGGLPKSTFVARTPNHLEDSSSSESEYVRAT